MGDLPQNEPPKTEPPKGDPGQESVQQLFGRLKPGQVWAVLGAFAVLISAIACGAWWFRGEVDKAAAAPEVAPTWKAAPPTPEPTAFPPSTVPVTTSSASAATKLLPPPGPAPPPPAGTSFHVESHDQSGGITAGIVNSYGTPARDLNDEQAELLLDALVPYQGTRINVFKYTLGGDIENLTKKITKALSGAGWIVTSLAGSEFGDDRSPRPKPGLLVEVRTPKGQAPANALAKALRGVGAQGPLAYDAFGRGGMQVQGSEDSTAAIQLTIGQNQAPPKAAPH